MHTVFSADLSTVFSNALAYPLIDFAFNEGDGSRADFDGCREFPLGHKTVYPGFAVTGTPLDFR